MKVKVLFFANLREQLGTSGEEIEVPAGVTTVGGLKSFLSQRGNAWKNTLSESKLVRMAINQTMVQQAAPIKAGDEVAFFPPVTGG